MCVVLLWMFRQLFPFTQPFFAFFVMRHTFCYVYMEYLTTHTRDYDSSPGTVRTMFHIPHSISMGRVRWLVLRVFSNMTRQTFGRRIYTVYIYVHMGYTAFGVETKLLMPHNL